MRLPVQIAFVLAVVNASPAFKANMSTDDGAISLIVDGVTWFSSAPVELFVNGRWYSAKAGNLKRVSAAADVSGSDNLGCT